jgi:hypothetical protein
MVSAVFWPLILGFLFLWPISLILLWLKWSHTLWMRMLMGAFWSLLTTAFGYMYYERYWRWEDCFNELGRCYDSEAGVMVEQASFIWGFPTLIFGLLTLGSLWSLLRRRTAPKAA